MVEQENCVVPDCFSTLDDVSQKAVLFGNSALVTANPGTGKTYLLACKFAFLIRNGVLPEDILCLTFTNKAQREMEDRIIKLLAIEKTETDLSKLNVYTFHSYALDYLDEGNIISTNLLRFVIYDFLKKNDVLNYPDEHLIGEIVPRLENLMRYLKSFGITPKDIDREKTRKLLEEFERSNDTIEKEDLEKFFDYFVDIFNLYEKEKTKKGIDYADLLINFLKIKNMPKFKWVLVDELQDVNELEAKIALQSGEKFFAVGDKKQAIFGFQGGSIKNFEEFKKKAGLVQNLKLNRRSTQQVLDFAAMDFQKKSADEESKNELNGLKSHSGLEGPKVKLIEASKEESVGKICAILNKIKGEEKIAIVVRTNSQIIELSKELDNRNIVFSSTFVSSSMEAKSNIIKFLKAVFSDNVDDVKVAFFTPFFPINLKRAFELSANRKLTLEDVLKECKEFKEIRENQKDIETVVDLFKQSIFPVCIAYGEEYLLAGQALLDSAQEALSLIDEKTLQNFILYLEAADLLSSTAKKQANITLTTVHKAKGLEYDKVIYVPKKTRNKRSFYDYIVEKILEANGLNDSIELEEETLRIDFVAFTRAKKELYVVTDSAKDYLNQHSEVLEIEEENTSVSFEELQKRAYSLFINKNYAEAKKLIEIKSNWIKEFVENHFNTLEHVSFSNLTTDAYDYFIKSVLQIRESNYATNLGTGVHDLLQSYLEGKEAVPIDEQKEFFENGKALISQIKKEYPEFVEAEYKIYVPLKKLLKTEDDLHFKGYIDAVFKNKDNYLIVDWKTSRTTNSASEYRRQLDLYRRTYAEDKGISPEIIKVAIGFIGIRKIINDGNIYSEIDSAQPRSTVFDTNKKHLQKFLDWKTNPENFFKELSETKTDDPLIRSVLEQYLKEKAQA